MVCSFAYGLTKIMVNSGGRTDWYSKGAIGYPHESWRDAEIS